MPKTLASLLIFISTVLAPSEVRADDEDDDLWLTPVRVHAAAALGGASGSDALEGMVIGLRAGATLYPGDPRGFGVGAVADFIAVPDTTQSFGGLGLELSIPAVEWEHTDLRLRPYVVRRTGLESEDSKTSTVPHLGVGLALSTGWPLAIFDFDYAGVRAELLFDPDGFDGVLFQVDITALVVLAFLAN